MKKMTNILIIFALVSISASTSVSREYTLHALLILINCITSYFNLARFLTDPLNQTAECIRQHLQNGYSDIGLPSFDPLEIDHLDVGGLLNNTSYLQYIIWLNSNIICWIFFFCSGALILNDILLSGIPEFYLTTIYSAISDGQVVINITINVDNITISSKYISDCQLLGFLNVYGTGDIG